jgi:hypothetical protein
MNGFLELDCETTFSILGVVQLRKLKKLNIIPPPIIIFWLEVVIWKIQTNTCKKTTRVSTFKNTYPT